MDGCTDPACTLEDCDACDECICHLCYAHIPEPHMHPCSMDNVGANERMWQAVQGSALAGPPDNGVGA